MWIAKMKRISKLDRSTLFLFSEAFISLGIARLHLLIPFSKIAPFLGNQMVETDYKKVSGSKENLVKVHDAIQIISQYTFWESKCLVRAIAAMKMLERRRIESTLYLGTATDHEGKMIAHAWLRSGDYYITGSEEMDRFTVIGKFAKETR